MYFPLLLIHFTCCIVLILIFSLSIVIKISLCPSLYFLSLFIQSIIVYETGLQVSLNFRVSLNIKRFDGLTANRHL